MYRVWCGHVRVCAYVTGGYTVGWPGPWFGTCVKHASLTRECCGVYLFVWAPNTHLVCPSHCL